MYHTTVAAIDATPAINLLALVCEFDTYQLLYIMLLTYSHVPILNTQHNRFYPTISIESDAALCCHRDASMRYDTTRYEDATQYLG